jgi:leucyl aminopeptidase
MKTHLSFSSPSEVETDCLVVIALDRGEKDKPNVSLQSDDGNLKRAAADVLANGETTGKIFETTLLHAPAKMKAKRLLPHTTCGELRVPPFGHSNRNPSAQSR